MQIISDYKERNNKKRLNQKEARDQGTRPSLLFAATCTRSLPPLFPRANQRSCRAPVATCQDRWENISVSSVSWGIAILLFLSSHSLPLYQHTRWEVERTFGPTVQPKRTITCKCTGRKLDAFSAAFWVEITVWRWNLYGRSTKYEV